MKWFSFIVLVVIFSCNAELKFPDGGFEYPKSLSGKDTNFYFYQLKNIEPPKDAFYDTYAHLFYRPFDEPNLSIKPQPNETFRLRYSPALSESIIVILTKNLITIKKGAPGILYDTDDTSRLS
jgi:hypothetical protein